jgi:hypothetical protein
MTSFHEVTEITKVTKILLANRIRVLRALRDFVMRERIELFQDLKGSR